MVNGTLSSWINVKSGVPQESVLGPLLFLLFVDDMDDEIRTSKIFKFADDTKIVHMFSKSQLFNNNLSPINEDLERLFKSCMIWQMRVNMEKTKCMHIGFSMPLGFSMVTFIPLLSRMVKKKSKLRYLTLH